MGTRDSSQAGGQAAAAVLSPRSQPAGQHLSIRTGHNGEYPHLSNHGPPQTISPSVLTAPQAVMTGAANSAGAPRDPTGLYYPQQLDLPDPSTQYSGARQFRLSGLRASDYAVSGQGQRRASTQSQTPVDASSLEPGYLLQWKAVIQARRSSILPDCFIYRDVIERLGPQTTVYSYPSRLPTMNGIQPLNGEFVRLTIQNRDGQQVPVRLRVVSRGSQPGLDDGMNIDLILGSDYLGQPAPSQAISVPFQQRRNSQIPGPNSRNWEIGGMFHDDMKFGEDTDLVTAM